MGGTQAVVNIPPSHLEEAVLIDDLHPLLRVVHRLPVLRSILHGAAVLQDAPHHQVRGDPADAPRSDPAVLLDQVLALVPVEAVEHTRDHEFQWLPPVYMGRILGRILGCI